MKIKSIIFLTLAINIRIHAEKMNFKHPHPSIELQLAQPKSEKFHISDSDLTDPEQRQEACLLFGYPDIAYMTGCSSPQRFQELLHERINDPDFQYFICTSPVNSQVIGILVAFTCAPQQMHLHTLAVHPDYRGLGLATKLMQHAQQFAVKNGIKKFSIQAFSHNEKAIACYKKFGFQEKQPYNDVHTCNVVRLEKRV